MEASEKQNLSISHKSISRRDLFKAGGVGAAILATVYTSSTAASSEGGRLAMVIDLQRCTGCGGCMISCKSENNVQRGIAWSSRQSKTVGEFPNVRYEIIPTLCNHCENAPCVKGCPTQAMYKGYGNITMHAPKKCIGCKTCMAMCPYGVISRHNEDPHQHWQSNESPVIKDCTSSPEEVTAKVKGDIIPNYNNAQEENAKGSGLRYKGIVEKCTLCMHRIKKGLLPHCVQSCPSDARIIGDLDDRNSAVSVLLALHRPWRLKEHLGTEPKVFYIRDFNPTKSERTKGDV